jgi:hypothetical protein
MLRFYLKYAKFKKTPFMYLMLTKIKMKIEMLILTIKTTNEHSIGYKYLEGTVTLCGIGYMMSSSLQKKPLSTIFVYLFINDGDKKTVTQNHICFSIYSICCATKNYIFVLLLFRSRGGACC